MIHLLDGMDYELVSSASSPDGQIIVSELHSSSEAGHAPYGQHLVLSRKKITRPGEEHVIFAGYCKSLSYSWASNTEIVVSCESSNTDAIKTKSIKALGIEIKYQ